MQVMNINKKIILSMMAGAVISITSLVALPQIALAADCNDGTTIPTDEVKNDNQTAFCQSHSGYTEPAAQKIYDRLSQAINILSGIVGIVVVVSIVVGGIQYTTSSGDPQKVAAAKSRIFNSVFALVAFIFTYAFLQYLVPGGVL